MRESDFSGSTFNGAYLEKAVAYKANFTGKVNKVTCKKYGETFQVHKILFIC